MPNRFFRPAVFWLVCSTLLAGAWRADAQQPRLPRGDASLTVGWLHSDVSNLGNEYDAWASRRVTLNGQAGMYWTEHWKTELAAERSNRQNRWHSTSVQRPGGELYRVTEDRIQDTRVSIGQFYQFGHNAWSHVLLGCGISVTRRHTISDVQPLTQYDRFGRVVVESGSTGSSTEVRAAPFAAAAVKGYLTPRAFVRADVQGDFRAELEALVLRIGFGFDF